MTTVETNILINAPAIAIFDSMVDPETIPKWAPISYVSNIKGNHGEIGSSADYALADYKLLFRVNVTQTMTVVEVDRPHRIVYQMAGGFPGKWTYTLNTERNGVRVNTKVHYTLRYGLIGEIANKAFIHRMHQKKTEEFAMGLKAFCESKFAT
jgi:uncharacterized protein YndB with AHSA1/START domain